MEKPEASIIVVHGIILKSLQSMGLYEVVIHMTVNALLEMSFTTIEANALFVTAMENMHRFDEALDLLKPVVPPSAPVPPGGKLQ